jgi:hypothetical protein
MIDSNKKIRAGQVLIWLLALGSLAVCTYGFVTNSPVNGIILMLIGAQLGVIVATGIPQKSVPSAKLTAGAIMLFILGAMIYLVSRALPAHGAETASGLDCTTATPNQACVVDVPCSGGDHCPDGADCIYNAVCSQTTCIHSWCAPRTVPPCGAYVPPDGCSEVERCACNPDNGQECTSIITCQWTNGQDWCTHELCHASDVPPPDPTPTPPPTPTPTAPPVPTATPTPDLVEKQRLTNQLKNQAHMMGDILAKEGTVMGAVGTFIAPLNPPAAIVAGEISALMSLGSLLYLAVDPFDPLFGEVVGCKTDEGTGQTTCKLDVQPFEIPTGLSGQVTNAYIALAKNLAVTNALLDAMNTSVNRANSALTMGDKVSEKMQVRAIKDFRRRAGRRVGQQKSLRKIFVRLYRAKYGSTITPEGRFPDLLVDPAELSVLTTVARELSR